MSWPVIAGCLWVLCATVTALMPMRHQTVPGLTLLIAAPVLIGWLGYAHGWWLSVLALLAFGSMFRNPLRYFYARARGQTPELPPEVAQAMAERAARRRGGA